MFNYLIFQPQDEATRTIERFTLTNPNYIRALEIFRERFGQEHKITSIFATMQALLNLPDPSNNLPSLRSWYGRIESYLRSLESLGQWKETYGSLLVVSF